ncbi:3-hydroxyacyl-CoA dehydrogenase [Flavobacterium lacus]|uniref:3-hydroxybutyryl-CoA dehydrogenase n=1 Tax=Flavobacterium lacus TaxID=1353778 RepID=A0A328WUU6_9FLAO|nr:3-hydroxyacyl-CoA dehydrogenase [Flavobacterium lacus]RAR47634.1 3-hydroxybutyryl-CoA dehydrogenase [Flavobacterium lacus]
MKIKKVTIAGSGVLGSQIAFQTAFHGYAVMVYDISDDILQKSKTTFKKLGDSYKTDLNTSQKQIDETMDRLSFSSDLAKAVANADLVIESVPEDPSIKNDFYKKLAAVAPEKTIFASNSSTMLPSQFAESTGRPAQFAALHFANEIWKHNTAEIMGHPGTDADVFDSLVAFAKSIGMVALPLKKEQPGYIVNSLLVPLLGAGLDLLVRDVADVHTIDKTWMVATGAPTGPFAILDVVGITTAYNINKMEAEKTGDSDKQKVVEYLKEHFIDKGKLGVATGEGFYTYPNPSFKDTDFLK